MRQPDFSGDSTKELPQTREKILVTYRISKHVAIEHFDEGSLALIVPQRRIVEIEPAGAEIIKAMEAGHPIEAVAEQLAERHQRDVQQTLADVIQWCERLKEERVLELVTNAEKVGMNTADTIQYMRDPDVVIREEDPEEGALLFHPDTNQVKVLNATGFYIWQACDQPATIAEITTRMVAEFEDADPAEVTADVQEFIEGMVATGFIGSVSPYEVQD